MVRNTQFIDLPHWDDDTGSLVAIEAEGTIPFGVQRVYYIFETTPGAHRGFHSHRDLAQLLICVHGSIDIIIDDGCTREQVTLDTPTKGLYIGPYVWREMLNFSDGSVLVVLANHHYDPADYIRDYDQFMQEAPAFFASAGQDGGAR